MTVLHHSGSAPAKAAPPSDDRRTDIVLMHDAQNPNLSRRSILAGLSAVPLAGVFPPAAGSGSPSRVKPQNEAPAGSLGIRFQLSLVPTVEPALDAPFPQISPSPTPQNRS